MVRQPIQDVVPPEKRSIRNVTLPNRARIDASPLPQQPPPRPTQSQPVMPPRPVAPYTNEQKHIPPTPPITPTRTRGRYTHFFMWLLALVAIVFFVGTILMVFSKAEVFVTTKKVPITIDTVMLADRSGSQESLPFETISLGKASSATVAATGEEFVSRKAFGTITIYNNYSSSPQRLVKNTRFEAPGGLIYRIDSSITIPGRSTKDGVTVPGSVDALVYADEAGPTYNIAAADFTIPGFKTDPNRYNKFYAKTKTPLSGGFIGTIPKVDPETLTTTFKKMEVTLIDALYREIGTTIPEDFLLLNGAVTFATSSLPTNSPEKGAAMVQLAATATAYIFPEQSFSQAIARIASPESTGPFALEKASDIAVTIERLPSKDNPTLSIRVSGNTNLTSVYDQILLKEALVGQPIKDAPTIISRFSALEGTPRVVVRPFFKLSFPATPERITIIEQGE